jgi:glyoxylase-like metal-dependent hydrolase (beta-lactamase superfamily II)
MRIHSFFDPATFTLTYVVFDPDSHAAVVIDPVLDYDPLASRVSQGSLEQVAAFVRQHGLRLHHILETHAHADHLSGAQALKRQLGGSVTIGEHITRVQAVFKRIFGLPDSFRTDGSQFDQLLADGAQLELGGLRIEALHTPGHTPACLSYRVGDAVFTGDALFIEDYGTGRCDFPSGSAEALYESIHDKLYRLPDATRVFVGHDYMPGGRPLRSETTIGRSKRENIQLRQDTSRQDFVAFRRARDATLTAPRLLFQSVQVNIDAGRLPAAAENGTRYLRIPINLGQPVEDDGTRQPSTPQG